MISFNQISVQADRPKESFCETKQMHWSQVLIFFDQNQYIYKNLLFERGKNINCYLEQVQGL